MTDYPPRDDRLRHLIAQEINPHVTSWKLAFFIADGILTSRTVRGELKRVAEVHAAGEHCGDRNCEHCWTATTAAVPVPAVPVSSPPPDQTALREAVLREAADFAAAFNSDCQSCAVELEVAKELRRLAAEAQQPDTETRDDIQVWPLHRVLTEVQCGSQDWSWEEEWADLDRRHVETGYLAKLEADIRENGITMPVLIGSDGRLWDGHHRLRIAVRLYIPYVPVEIVPPAADPQPVQHAPGKAVLCPDCHTKGHAICMSDEEPRREPHPTQADLDHALTVLARFEGRDTETADTDQTPPAHTGGNAEDCPACVQLGFDMLSYPWECPGPEKQPTASAESDRLRCPQCGEDITDYSEDDHVFRTGDDRPYCSGECVVAAHRAEPQPPAHIGGVADDCPACQAQGLHTIGHPYECPGSEK